MGNVGIIKYKDPDGTWRDIPALKGDVGPKGQNGKGVPRGGGKGQFLWKTSDLDYETAWKKGALPPKPLITDKGKILAVNENQEYILTEPIEQITWQNF